MRLQYSILIKHTNGITFHALNTIRYLLMYKLDPAYNIKSYSLYVKRKCC